MKAKVVTKTSIFPAGKDKVFELLQRLDTLQFIAKPYATFDPINNTPELIWQPGASFSFRFKMFGIISLGIHKIDVLRFEKDEVYTNEGNQFCPTWNHRIILKEIDKDHVKYTDEVEIHAGWKTPFVYLWANAFYRHRQKKWLGLLS